MAVILELQATPKITNISNAETPDGKKSRSDTKSLRGN
jgi:hypothetical protein